MSDIIPQLNVTLEQLGKQLQSKPGSSVACLLPLLFNFNGKPLEITKDYFFHEPVFKLNGRPQKTLLKASRQVGKSLGAAADSIMLTSLIPNFKTMIAFPLQSQANLFSSDYVQKLIDGSPFFKHLSIDNGGKSAVFQKDVGDNGSMYFRYIGNGADRARGSMVDMLAVDECKGAHTRLDTPRGSIKITDVTKGTEVYAFDPSTGNVVTAVAGDPVFKGIRPTWRVRLEDGSEFDCTDNERLWTSAGWATLSQVYQATRSIASTGRFGATGGTRFHARGRIYRRLKADLRNASWDLLECDMSAVPSVAERGPSRASGISGVVVEELHTNSSYYREEPRVRRLPGQVQHADHASHGCTGSALLQHGLGKEQDGQNSNARVAEPSHVGRDRSLGYGRRASDVQQQLPPEYAGFHGAGEPPIGELADSAGLRSFSVFSKELEDGKAILYCQAQPRRVLVPVGADKAVYAAVDAVQGCTEAPDGAEDLHHLSADIYDQPARAVRAKLLRQQDLRQRRAPDGCIQELAGTRARSGASIGDTGRNASEYSGHGHEAAEVTGTSEGGQARYTPENAACSEDVAKASSSAQGRTESLLGTEDGEVEIFRLVRAVHEGQERQEKCTLKATKVVSVTYVGEQAVYDVATSGHHTLFANGMAVHNCQDHDPDNVEVIIANMMASLFKLQRLSGTPKTRDNYMEKEWLKSSQGIWNIKCTSCNHWNACSAEEDLIKMLGKDGLICAKCGRYSINPRGGGFKHRRPDRIHTYAGYEMPGPILPRCYENKKEWAILKDAQENKPPYIFYNEWLGCSFDSGAKLITWTDLEKAAVVPWKTLDQMQGCSGYLMSSVGVDWGGKGKLTDKSKEEFISNTAMAVAYLREDHKIDIPWLYTTPYEASYDEEAEMGLSAFGACAATWFAHDAGGGGDLRQSIMTAKGLPLEDIAPYTYGSLGADKPIVYYKPPEREGARVSYTVDKTRAISLVIELIKRGYVRLPEIEKSRPFLADFLALFEETREGPTGAPRKLIRRISSEHDDIVHAIVFSVLILYHHTGLWPEFARELALPEGSD